MPTFDRYFFDRIREGGTIRDDDRNDAPPALFPKEDRFTRTFFAEEYDLISSLRRKDRLQKWTPIGETCNKEDLDPRNWEDEIIQLIDSDWGTKSSDSEQEEVDEKSFPLFSSTDGSDFSQTKALLMEIAQYREELYRDRLEYLYDLYSFEPDIVEEDDRYEKYFHLIDHHREKLVADRNRTSELRQWHTKNPKKPRCFAKQSVKSLPLSIDYRRWLSDVPEDYLYLFGEEVEDERLLATGDAITVPDQDARSAIA